MGDIRMKYRVRITEEVAYDVYVEADCEDEAKEFAMTKHEDGESIEVDNGPAIAERAEVVDES